MSEEQRTISLGFEEPSELDGNTIYATLQLRKERRPFRKEVIGVTAVSNEPFTYHGGSLDEHLLICNHKDATSRTVNDSTWWYRGYQEFIDDLVKSNNGVLDYSRLIQEGVTISAKIKKIYSELTQTS